MATLAQLGVEPVIDPEGMVLHGQIYVPAASFQGFVFPRGVDEGQDGTNAGYADLAVQFGHASNPVNNEGIFTTAGTGGTTSIGGTVGQLILIEGLYILTFPATGWISKVVMSGWKGRTTYYGGSLTVASDQIDRQEYIFPVPVQASAVNTAVTMTLTNNAGGNLGSTVLMGLWGRKRPT